MSELLRQSTTESQRTLPRMTQRYPSDLNNVTLRLPTQGIFRRARTATVSCDVIDLSIDGALLALRSETPIGDGIRTELMIQGETATVGIRHVDQTDDGRHCCGVAFRTTSPGFRALVNSAIVSAITDPRRNDPWRMNG